MLARWEARRVRVYTRNGNDWSTRYPLLVDAASSLRCRSCLIDGEVVVTDEDGERLRIGESYGFAPTLLPDCDLASGGA
jgi:ATP-dependent DNA ligase